MRTHALTDLTRLPPDVGSGDEATLPIARAFPLHGHPILYCRTVSEGRRGVVLSGDGIHAFSCVLTLSQCPKWAYSIAETPFSGSSELRRRRKPPREMGVLE